MPLPAHQTKIVATIGPASESPAMLERLIRAGLDIAQTTIANLKALASGQPFVEGSVLT